MDIKDKYKFKFYKRSNAFGKIVFNIQSEDIINTPIASHIYFGDAYLTQDQITELDKALKGIRVQEEWGEIMGSQLEIFPLEGTVQVGYTNRKIPIQDFKELLEDWLAFITS